MRLRAVLARACAVYDARPGAINRLLNPLSVKAGLIARRLLLRSAFKQPVADLLRYEALRPLPCLVVVAAEREELPEHDALGCRIDGSSPRRLHQRAHLVNGADDQDLRAGL